MPRLTTLFACSMFALVTVCSVILPASADGTVTMKRGEVGDDRAFIKQYLDNILRDYGRKFGPMKVFTGKSDITKDGKPELFVFIADIAYCGSVGCETHIFRKVSGKWTLFATLHVLSESVNGHSKKTLSTRDDGGPYLTIFSYYYGLRWSDKYKDYESYCHRTCPR